MMHVVLVGHCSPDAFMLKSMVGRVLPEATLHTVNDQASLDAVREDGAVWLVNRILDGLFDAGESGLDLIEARVKSVPGARVLLISDLAPHQETAESLGARPGFGKKGLYESESAHRLQSAAGH